MVEFPQGHVVEERRGGAGILATLIAEMVKLESSGIIRSERKPSQSMPRVGQIIIQEGAMVASIHEGKEIVEGVEALIEVESDCMELECVIQLSEGVEINKILDLYPSSLIDIDAPEASKSDKWWHEVKTRPSGWKRASRLPEVEASEGVPEFIQRKAAAMIHRHSDGGEILKPGSAFLLNSKGNSGIFDLASILANHGRPLLVISRRKTSELSENHNISSNQCLWLSQNEQEGVQIASLEEVNSTVNDFFETNIRAVFVLEGIEYLASICGNDGVINLIRDIADHARANDHCLLIEADLEAFSEKEAILLSRETPVIDAENISNWNNDPDSLLNHPLLAPLTNEEMEILAKHIENSLPPEFVPMEDEIVEIESVLSEEIPIEIVEEEQIIISNEVEAQPMIGKEAVVTKGPRPAQRVRKRLSSSPDILDKREVANSGLAAVGESEIDSELPAIPELLPKVALVEGKTGELPAIPELLPKVVLGKGRTGELPAIPEIIPTSLTDVVRESTSKMISELPKINLGPKPLDSVMSSRGAKPMAGPLDARRISIDADVTERSQAASREQKIPDLDAELRSWKFDKDELKNAAETMEE